MRQSLAGGPSYLSQSGLNSFKVKGLAVPSTNALARRIQGGRCHSRLWKWRSPGTFSRRRDVAY